MMGRMDDLMMTTGIGETMMTTIGMITKITVVVDIKMMDEMNDLMTVIMMAMITKKFIKIRGVLVEEFKEEVGVDREISEVAIVEAEVVIEEAMMIIGEAEMTIEVVIEVVIEEAEVAIEEAIVIIGEAEMTIEADIEVTIEVAEVVTEETGITIETAWIMNQKQALDVVKDEVVAVIIDTDKRW